MRGEKLGANGNTIDWVHVLFCVCCIPGRLCVVHMRSDKKMEPTEIVGEWTDYIMY